MSEAREWLDRVKANTHDTCDGLRHLTVPDYDRLLRIAEAARDTAAELRLSARTRRRTHPVTAKKWLSDADRLEGKC